MKKALCAVLFAAGMNLLYSAPDQIVFEADFTKGVEAKTAQKTVKPYPVKTGTKTAFESDAERGLIIGEGKASAYFPIAGLLNKNAGSIEISVRNIDWDVKDRKIHLFLYADQPGLLYFYKHSNDGVAVYCSNPENRQKIFLGKMPDWKPDTVHHCVFTWDNGKLALYIDGNKASEKKFELPEKMPQRIFVGNPGSSKMNNGTTGIRLLRIYGTALAPKEISTLFRKNLPEDKDVLDE